jgi:hypothetical protein
VCIGGKGTSLCCFFFLILQGLGEMFSTSPTMLFLYCSTSNTTLASIAPVARSTSANSESRFLTGQLLTGAHAPLQFLTQRVVDGLAYALQASC